MWIFQPLKLHRKKYVETTWIFRSAKLHRKSTWKWRVNSSKLALCRIDVVSTSNRCGVSVGLLLFFHYSSHHHNRYHHFHYHCKMHLDRLRILLTIPLDFNMIPCLFQQNFVFLGETKLICWSTSPTDPILSKTIKIIWKNFGELAFC